jgi:hypothetical protein
MIKDKTINKIIKWQLKKKVKYHPILKKTFNDEELELIFRPSNNIEAYKEDIKEIKRFVNQSPISTIKELIELIRTVIPSYYKGLYNGEKHISVQVDPKLNKVLIEQFVNDDTGEVVNIKNLLPQDLLSIYQS